MPIIYGTNYSDSLRGGQNTTVKGLGGDDVITGTMYAEFLSGGDGNDRITSGGGADNINGDVGNDTIILDGSGSFASGGDGNDRFEITGYQNRIYGDEGDDTFVYSGGFLSSGSNTYWGGGGFDVLKSGQSYQDIGIDFINGIEKIDASGQYNVNIIMGKSGSLDLSGVQIVGISEIKGSSGDDFIYLQGSGTNDSLILSRDDLVRGGAGNDFIDSGFGKDQLFGDAGNDRLVGGLNSDQLTGGSGSDTFVYNSIADSTLREWDTILDFSSAQGDKIDLSLIDANANIAGDQLFTYVGGSSFSGRAGELRSEFSGGYLHVTGDVNGDKVADFDIALKGISLLNNSDFVL